VIGNNGRFLHQHFEEVCAMNIADVMSQNVTLVSPDARLVVAAEAMAEREAGALPVGEGDQLIGMITDRDIVVRGVASGKPVERMLVREAMTPQVLYCFEDQPCDEVARNMAEVQASRLPVVNRDKRLVGIVSVGDFARSEPETAKTAEEGVASPTA
jgi:CBS domain-containing protein